MKHGLLSGSYRAVSIEVAALVALFGTSSKGEPKKISLK